MRRYSTIWSFRTEFVNERATHAHAPTTASPRVRTGSLCVKHGCAFEERKMLNCVAEIRQKRKSWHDWLIISQWWDTIRIKPVRCGADVKNAVIYSGRHCCGVSKLLQYKSAAVFQEIKETAFTFFHVLRQILQTVEEFFQSVFGELLSRRCLCISGRFKGTLAFWLMVAFLTRLCNSFSAKLFFK